MPGTPSKLQQLKAQLAARGLAPRKIFGQNFMLDGNFAAAVARDARAGAQTLLVEIGPGTGCLTRELLSVHPNSRVLAVEIDSGLAALLRDTFAEELSAGKLVLVEGDILAGKHRLSPAVVNALAEVCAREARTQRVLCANLPYNAATPLIVNLALDAQDTAIARIVATIQYEMAERLFARPGDSNYGPLAALLELRASGRILRKVGGDIFWPRPDVDSAVIELDLLPWAATPRDGLQKHEAPSFNSFLHRIFGQRRKTLRAILKPAALPTLPGLASSARAEELPPALLLELFRALRNC